MKFWSLLSLACASARDYSPYFYREQEETCDETRLAQQLVHNDTLESECVEAGGHFCKEKATVCEFFPVPSNRFGFISPKDMCSCYAVKTARKLMKSPGAANVTLLRTSLRDYEEGVKGLAARQADSGLPALEVALNITLGRNTTAEPTKCEVCLANSKYVAKRVIFCSIDEPFCTPARIAAHMVNKPVKDFPTLGVERALTAYHKALDALGMNERFPCTERRALKVELFGALRYSWWERFRHNVHYSC